jgi:hypothetical protein
MADRDFTVDGLKEWEGFIASLGTTNRRYLTSRVLRSSGLRVLEYLYDLTPVRTGRLANSFLFNTPDNIFELKLGRTVSSIRIGTSVEYAKWVNDGFQQRAGQFVPGTWSSGQFHYDPDAYPQGMVLTGKYVEGCHMLDKAMDYMEEDIAEITMFELQRLWSELGGG